MVYHGYVVYENGTVISKQGKIKIPHKNKQNGYWQIDLQIEGKRVTVYIHRLVATLFLPNPNNLPHVAHKDQNKDHNYSSNLQWSSESDNELDKNSYIKGFLYAEKFGVEYGPFRGVEEAAIFLHLTGTIGAIHSSISKCIKGENKTAKGYKWFRK